MPETRIIAIAAALLVGTAAVAYAQGSMTRDPGNMTPGNLPTDRLGSGSDLPATGGYGALGAGDPAAGNWSQVSTGLLDPRFGTQSAINGVPAAC